jgi:hypothetical protein
VAVAALHGGEEDSRIEDSKVEDSKAEDSKVEDKAAGKALFVDAAEAVVVVGEEMLHALP